MPWGWWCGCRYHPVQLPVAPISGLARGGWRSCSSWSPSSRPPSVTSVVVSWLLSVGSRIRCLLDPLSVGSAVCWILRPAPTSRLRCLLDLAVVCWPPRPRPCLLGPAAPLASPRRFAPPPAVGRVSLFHATRGCQRCIAAAGHPWLPAAILPSSTGHTSPRVSRYGARASCAVCCWVGVSVVFAGATRLGVVN